MLSLKPWEGVYERWRLRVHCEEDWVAKSRKTVKFKLETVKQRWAYMYVPRVALLANLLLTCSMVGRERETQVQ